MTFFGKASHGEFVSCWGVCLIIIACRGPSALNIAREQRSPAQNLVCAGFTCDMSTAASLFVSTWNLTEGSSDDNQPRDLRHFGGNGAHVSGVMRWHQSSKDACQAANQQGQTLNFMSPKLAEPRKHQRGKFSFMGGRFEIQGDEILHRLQMNSYQWDKPIPTGAKRISST